MNKKSISVIVVLTFCLFLCSIQSSSAEPLGTAFTYQGRLIDANNPADGEYDLQFKIYDAETDGNQAGEDVNMPDVDVIDGYFTVELDFGNVFTGEARWLEIGVRTGDSNDVFTVLSPRQKITALPYALYAASGIYSTGSTETDIVTGSKLYNDMIPYTVDIGFVKDVSSEIAPGFTLIDVTAKGRKTDLGGTLLEEAPLNIYPKVNGTNIEIRVWDADGTEYKDWSNTRAHIEYTLFMKKSGVYCPPHDHDERYYTKTEVDTMLADKADKTEVDKKYAVFAGNLDGTPFEASFPAEWAGFSKVEAIATGYKYNTMDDSKQGPLIVIATVDTHTDKVMFEIWDTNGSEYGGSGWAGNEAHIDFVVFGTR